MTGDAARHEHPHTHADEPMRPLGEVQALVLERCRPLEVVEVGLGDALGCVLAEDAVVVEDVPPFANTAMDGYALRATETAGGPVELSVTGVLAAGSPPPAEPVGAGEALQIMTGAPMPKGADAVAIVERTERIGGGRVRILDTVEPGTNVRPPGSDFVAGEVALQAGTLLGPAHLGVLATIGKTAVSVVRRPRVGVMSTGDELVEGGGPLEPGQIRDSNRLSLLALCRLHGFEVVDLGVVRDSAEEVERALTSASKSCDAVLSSGGVSKGEFDFVKGVLDRLAAGAGGESFELAVAIRPAKPLALAWLPRPDEGDRKVAFFGLPGNPVSSMVSFQVVALPGLRQMAGHAEPLPAPVRAIAAAPLRPSRDGRLNLLRVAARFRPDGRVEVDPSLGQQSHQLSGMVGADALALVPPGDEVPAGDEIDVLFLRSVC